MSSSPIKKIPFVIDNFDSSYRILEEESINIHDVIIPFSKFGYSKPTIFIYDGNEKISFKNRHPTFQDIFLEEFTNRR